jgi:Domain of unknown function (DUF4157)
VSNERRFRGDLDRRDRPHDWHAIAERYGITEQLARELHDEAVRLAYRSPGSDREEESIYRDLLEQAGYRPLPGKVTRTMRLGRAMAGRRPFRGMPLPGKRTLTSYLPTATGGTTRSETEGVTAIARHGQDGTDEQLPHAEQIQCSFGRHDVSQVRAHTGKDAADAAAVLGARAYTHGDRIAFRGAPDLHTAAHEAAHVIQQRAGVAPAGLDGGAASAFERQADQIADAVVRGQSAEPLLDRIAPTRGSSRSSHAAVQRDEEPGGSLLAAHDSQVRDALLFESGNADSRSAQQRAERLAAAIDASPVEYRRVLLGRLRKQAPDDDLAQLFLRLPATERSALLSIVARRTGEARRSPLDLGQPSRPVRKLGRVQAPLGIYLRQEPAPGAARTSETIIPFNGLVFVDRETTQPAVDERWAYVVATQHGRAGFVEQRYIAVDPPDPSARLRRITRGETLGQIASGEYGASFTGADNQRLYVQGLYEANKDRAGVKLDEVELSAGQTLARQEAEEETLKIYLGVQVREGMSLWIPSQAFIQQLKAAGAITGGSTEFSKAFRTTKAALDATVEAIRYGAGFIVGMLDGSFDAIVDLFAGAAEMVEAVMKVLWHLITGNPGAIKAMLTGWARQMASLWENKEAIADEFLNKWNAADQWERGLFQGQVLGWLMMTILLVVLTLGESAPAVVAGLATKFPRLIQLLKVVDAVGDVATYARAVGKGLVLPTKAFDAVKNRVGKAGDVADDAAEKAAAAGKAVPDKSPAASDGIEMEVGKDREEVGAETATGVPLGFPSAAALKRFARLLRAGLAKAGFDDVSALFQGSSVTGRSFRTGAPFDVGRPSDFDIALASPTLLDRAKSLGIRLRSGGARTGPLTAAQIDQLGLRGVHAELSKIAGRPVNFMIFGDAAVAAARSPSLQVF